MCDVCKHTRAQAPSHYYVRFWCDAHCAVLVSSDATQTRVGAARLSATGGRVVVFNKVNISKANLLLYIFDARARYFGCVGSFHLGGWAATVASC